MDDQSTVLAFLGDGASYGRPGLAVTRIDTHASSVFVAGDRVYKLKRAVVFSYLDYGTVERREAACRAELELNRRAAPELYLAVRKIARRDDGKLGFDGAATAVDWVVEMRRFDEACRFDHLGEAGKLTPALMRELADEIAAFHAGAAPSSEFGGSADFAAMIQGNDQNLRLAGAVFDAAQIDRLDVATRDAFTRVAALLDARRRVGKIRRCHGDLHLGNICLFNGKPLLFDCVEFSAAFATIDIVYDVAFLLMDLWHRGWRDEASLVFNRYFDRTAEDEALPALPLFLSQRAAIRAHVTVAAMARDAEAQAGDRLRATAHSYLDLAVALLRPGATRLIAVGGLSGSGKSTIAQGLAADLAPAPGARVIRSDVIRKILAGVAPETRLPAASYQPAMSERVYGEMARQAASALRAGYAAIVDATFLEATSRAAIAELAAAEGVPFTGLWLDASPAALRARISGRRNDASDAGRAVLEAQLQRPLGPLDWQRVAAGGDVAESLAVARRALD
jgi:aminoglycoside phosphotransferase family enzyme/predicted kinase